MLVKLYIEDFICPKIIEIPEEYDFYIQKEKEDFNEEEKIKAEKFYDMLYNIIDMPECVPFLIDFNASRQGVEKKIDTAIKDWFCYGESEEDCKILRGGTVDELFKTCCLSKDEAWDLIAWLRKHCN